MKHDLPTTWQERTPRLRACRADKMAASVEAYVRGSADLFYDWIAQHAKSLPEGPAIWISGDCHHSNLGPLAAADGAIRFELRDFDQAVVGSPAHDLVRLALSIAMAVRASGLPGASLVDAIDAVAGAYAEELEARAEERGAAAVPASKPIERLLKRAHRRTRAKMLEEEIGRRETIPFGRCFWPLTDAEHDAVRSLICAERTRRLVATVTDSGDDADIAVRDAAFWVKGCSSLGSLRCAALVRARGRHGKATILVDIKEARPPIAPWRARPSLLSDEAARVVAAASVLSPALGERTIAGTADGRSVFVRELRPEDLKLEVQTFTNADAASVGAYLARVVGAAHARQLTPSACGDWLRETRTSANGAPAPRWLWNAVTDLVGLHESAYLDHCRALHRADLIHATTPRDTSRLSDATADA